MRCLGDVECDDDAKVLTELPCSKLHELYVAEFGMQLGPTSQHPGILHAKTGLSKLVLRLGGEVHFAGGPDPFTALHALPALQHFDMSVRQTASRVQKVR